MLEQQKMYYVFLTKTQRIKLAMEEADDGEGTAVA